MDKSTRMYDRLDEYERNFGPLDPLAKALFFYAYSIARVDADFDALDRNDPN